MPNVRTSLFNLFLLICHADSSSAFSDRVQAGRRRWIGEAHGVDQPRGGDARGVAGASACAWRRKERDRQR